MIPGSKGDCGFVGQFSCQGHDRIRDVVRVDVFSHPIFGQVAAIPCRCTDARFSGRCRITTCNMRIGHCCCYLPHFSLL